MASDPILTAFERLVAARGEAALVGSPRRQATVAEVDAAARAAGLALGAEALVDQLIGLAAPNGPAFLAGYLAVRRAGGVPLLLDPTSPSAAQREATAGLGGGRLLATDDGWASQPGAWRCAAIDSATPPLAIDRSFGAVKLTSGSTGAPRGIGVTAEALLADDRQLTATMGLTARDRMVAAVPLSHSYGFASLALPALVRGTLLLVPEDRSPLAHLAAAIAGEATFLPTVPAWLGALVRLAAPPPLPPTVRLVISAGATLAPETAARFFELYGRRVQVFYGASECGGIAFDRVGGAAERGTVGTLVDGVAVELEAESGRLAVRSAAVATSYLPEVAPELGAGRFLTGDLAVWRDGELALAGRADDLLIVKGHNVNPREVEHLLNGIAGVREVAVIGVPAAGDVGPLVRAIIACAPGRLTYEEVTAFARRHLPEHKVPRSIVFVEELPRSERGKLDRRTLLALEPIEPGALRDA